MEPLFRFYLPVVVLVPIGVLAIVLGTFASSTASVATTLVILGAGMVVVGGLSTRLKGRFAFGPKGVEGSLSEADASMLAGAVTRLREAQEAGRIAAAELPGLEEAAAAAVLTVRRATRRHFARRRSGEASPPGDPTEAGRRLAEAILEAATVGHDPD